MVIYFSKLNLISIEIFKVYDDMSYLNEILDILYSDIEDGIVYEKDDIYIDEETKKKYITTSRSTLHIRKKYEGIIEGYIYKNSQIYYKEYNEKEDKLQTKSHPNTERIQFYFDVFKETIGFHTSRRFGFQEFNDVFLGIINNCLTKNGRAFRFEITLLTRGLNFKEIKNSLKQIGTISEMKLKFHHPNPDSDTIYKIRKNGETHLKDMKDANITEMSILFSSKGGSINIDSDLVDENLNIINDIGEVIGDRKAVSKGYLSVEAKSNDGRKFSTATSRPLKTEIENESEFIEKCKRIIGEI